MLSVLTNVAQCHPLYMSLRHSEPILITRKGEIFFGNHKIAYCNWSKIIKYIPLDRAVQIPGSGQPGD